MRNILKVILNKPPIIILSVLIYLFGIALLKWKFNPPLNAVYYICGGLIGIFFIDLAEMFFKLKPSPFKTILFQILFTVLSIFVVTSSGSIISSGIVLSLFLVILLTQLGELQLLKNLNSWYELLNIRISAGIQKQVLIIFTIIFLVLSYLFIK